MKRRDWAFMVVRRYYGDACEVLVFDRKEFRRDDFLHPPKGCRQEFYPCADFEKAVKIMCNIKALQKSREKEPSK